MKDNYDFSKGLKNPYVDQLMTQVTINLANNVIEYFKEMSEKTGIPYQTLINMYLLGHRMGILGRSTAEMKMSLGC